MNPSAFFIAKMLETRQRHVKFGDTPYSLEPNCKESPGGLRDLQVILWTAKAANSALMEPARRRGLLTPTEAQQLKKTEEAFKDIRIRLHIQTQRCEDKRCLTSRFRLPKPLISGKTASRSIPAVPANT